MQNDLLLFVPQASVAYPPNSASLGCSLIVSLLMYADYAHLKKNC